MKAYEVIGVDPDSGVLSLEIRGDLLAPLANYLFRYRDPEPRLGRRSRSFLNPIYGLAKVLQGASQVCYVGQNESADMRCHLQKALAQQLGIALLEPYDDDDVNDIEDADQELCATA